jgi:hypothetical protein
MTNTRRATQVGPDLRPWRVFPSPAEDSRGKSRSGGDRFPLARPDKEKFLKKQPSFLDEFNF